MARRKAARRAAREGGSSRTTPSPGTSPTSHPKQQPHATRLPAIDALRGIAIVAMIAYHFAFDLRWFDLIAADFENDRFWLSARAAIVTSFLLLVGVSLTLAERAGVPAAHFLKRIGVVALCAIAVSVASYLVSPTRFIYFGILHCIVIASLVARPLAGRPVVATLAGVAVIALGLWVSHPFFDARIISWLGFTTVKPPTQDFVPLFPWLGVVLLGVGLGAWLASRDYRPVAPLANAPRDLRWLGRHSLAVYMIHQPILLGSLWLVFAR